MEIKGKLGPHLSKIKNKSGEYEVLQLLEGTLDTYDPEASEVPIKLLGYGEISIVFELLTEKSLNLAFKRLPLFETFEQVNQHIKGYNEYNRILEKQLGIYVPESDTAWVYADEDHKKITLYCIQSKLLADSIGNKIIHRVEDEELRIFTQLALREMKKIWEHNRSTPAEKLQIGLDGQISNWAIKDFDPSKPEITTTTSLIYLDTSTPMYRINGEDAMEGALFLKSAPSFLRWALKGLMAEVLDRYYDWREVLKDLVANFYKEQLPEKVPLMIATINEFLETEAADFNIKPLTEKEIKSYYKHDKFIWVLFQSMRKFDRFLQVKILRRKYDFYLPGKIKR